MNIYNEGVTVEREGRRRFAVMSNGHRWGYFLLRRDAEQFAEDARHGRAFFSEPGQRMIAGLLSDCGLCGEPR